MVGVYAPGRPVGSMALAGHLDLHHRGQESAGIAVANGEQIAVAKGMGIAEIVFTFDQDVPDLENALLAVGHDRYTTSGGLCDAQPLEFNGLVIAHNGNLTNASSLRAEYPPPSVDGQQPVSDTAVALQLLAHTDGASTIDRLSRGLRRLQGAYAMVLATSSALYGARDPHGFRPLVLGRTEGGWVLASETAAFTRMRAEFVRELEPGEIVEIDAAGVGSHHLGPLSPPPPARCIFELVYLSRPDSTIFGRSVEQFRRLTGEVLARKAPVDADLVMAVPRSGIAATVGYAASETARAMGITYQEGLLTNAYSGLATGFRTFIQPTGRDAAAVIKYSVIEPVVREKRVIVVDDSVVRGSFRHIAAKLRAAGARAVHLRIACPPLIGGCYYGVDFGDGELLANRVPDLDDRAAFLGVDSLVHVSCRELVEIALEKDLAGVEHDDPDVFLRHGYCGACFTRNYPTNVTGTIPRDQAAEDEAGALAAAIE
ncbi:MAG: amidophosphoribosyltransferase [Anaerolineae bacterium]